MRNYIKKSGSVKKPNGYWKCNKERCIEEAGKYGSIMEWQKNSSGSLGVAYKLNWMSECTAHMYKSYKSKFSESDSKVAVRKNIDLKIKMKKEKEIMNFLGLAKI